MKRKEERAYAARARACMTRSFVDNRGVDTGAPSHFRKRPYDFRGTFSTSHA